MTSMPELTSNLTESTSPQQPAQPEIQPMDVPVNQTSTNLPEKNKSFIIIVIVLVLIIIGLGGFIGYKLISKGNTSDTSTSTPAKEPVKDTTNNEKPTTDKEEIPSTEEPVKDPVKEEPIKEEPTNEPTKDETNIFSNRYTIDEFVLTIPEELTVEKGNDMLYCYDKDETYAFSLSFVDISYDEIANDPEGFADYYLSDYDIYDYVVTTFNNKKYVVFDIDGDDKNVAMLFTKQTDKKVLWIYAFYDNDLAGDKTLTAIDKIVDSIKNK